MKKKNQKVVALAVLVLIGFVAYKNKDKIFGKKVSSEKKPVMKTDALKTEFETKPDTNGNYTKFWFDGKDYYQQKMGPTVRSVAVKVTKADFDKQYAN